MKLVFWWNMPNPHMVPFFSALAGSGRFACKAVYEEHVPDWRKQSGWRDETEDLESIFLEGEDWKGRVEEILKESQESISMFPGIGAYPKTCYALKKALRRNIVCFAISERSVSAGHGLFYFLQQGLNRIRRFRLGRHLRGMFVIGQMGREYFQKVGYCPEQIFDWMYFVENRHWMIPEKPHDPVRMVFVGQMVPRKGVDTLLRALARVKREFTLDLYGTGPQLEEYQELGGALKEGTVKWHGMVANEKVVEELPCYDILALPSQGRGDGWGAVVNEAINAGCAVICSDLCGSKDLVQYGRVGEIFEAGRVDSLEAALDRLLEKGQLEQCQKNAIVYQEKIDPKRAVDYFERVITGKEAKAPWLC